MNSTSPAAVDEKRLEGLRLGPYLVLEEIGRGAIGIIYRARRADTPDGPPVAIKVLVPAAAKDHEERARLAREWRTLGRLEHPSIVRLLDHGETEGQLWFAMELAVGPSLDQVVRRVRALDPDEVLFLARSLASALAAIHAGGVVHRDVKPGNLVFDLPRTRPEGGEPRTNERAQGRVVLVDFGLARRPDDSIVVTRDGAVAGSPAFMAPERFRGEPLDPRSDLYALGATLYFAATGSPPFHAKDEEGMKRAHLEEKPVAMSELVPSLAPALSSTIDALLSKDPAARPGAAEVVAKLTTIDRAHVMPITLAAAVVAAREDPSDAQQTLGGDGAVRHVPRLGRFGRYELEAELARGGMGVVYRARLPDLPRPFALKVMLSGEHAGESQRRRFLREVEAAAALDHPGIVRVHDFGEHEGRAYYVMELVEGCPLSAHYRGKTADPGNELLKIFSLICDAVHYAHSRGIIHRDLKPSNVVVDPQQHAHILDFGLAKRVSDVEATQLTNEGEVVGTAAYMSPEQAEGRVRDIDTRSDVYALGVILYELVTRGRLPFEGQTVREILNGIHQGEARPPSTFAPKLPWELDAIVLKAIEKQPSRRYQSAAALAEDVRRFVEGLPIEARRAGVLYRTGKLLRRNARLVAAVVLAGLAAGSVYGVQRHLEHVRVLATVAEAEASLQTDPERARELFGNALALDAYAPGAEIGKLRADHAIEARAAQRRTVERRDQAAKLVSEGKRRLAERDPEQAKKAFFQAFVFDGANADAAAGLDAAARLAFELESSRRRERDQAEAKRLVGEGDKLLASGDTTGARRAYDQALGFDGKNAEALVGLAGVAKRVEEERQQAKRAEGVRSLAQGREALERARNLLKAGERNEARRGYYDALAAFERASLAQPDEEGPRNAKAEAARELARIARDEGRFDLAEFLQRLAGEAPPNAVEQPLPVAGDERLQVREADSVMVQRAFGGEPVEFAPGDAPLAALKEEAAPFGDRYQVQVDIRSRIAPTTAPMPPKIFVMGLVVRVHDNLANVTSTPEKIDGGGGDEGFERIVVATPAGRTIRSWDVAIGIDRDKLRERAVAVVRTAIAKFESQRPSPGR